MVPGLPQPHAFTRSGLGRQGSAIITIYRRLKGAVQRYRACTVPSKAAVDTCLKSTIKKLQIRWAHLPSPASCAAQQGAPHAQQSCSTRAAGAAAGGSGDDFYELLAVACKLNAQPGSTKQLELFARQIPQVWVPPRAAMQNDSVSVPTQIDSCPTRGERRGSGWKRVDGRIEQAMQAVTLLGEGFPWLTQCTWQDNTPLCGTQHQCPSPSQAAWADIGGARPTPDEKQYSSS